MLLDAGVGGQHAGHDAGEIGALLLDEVDRGDRVRAVLDHGVDIDEDLAGVLVGDLLELVLEAVGDDEDHVGPAHGGLQRGLVLAGVEVGLDGARLDAVLFGQRVDARLAGVIERVVAQRTVDEIDHTLGWRLSGSGLACRGLRGLRRGTACQRCRQQADDQNGEDCFSHDVSSICAVGWVCRRVTDYARSYCQAAPFAKKSDIRSSPGAGETISGILRRPHYLGGALTLHRHPSDARAVVRRAVVR